MLYALKLIEVPEGTSTELVGKIIKLKKLPSTLGRGKDAMIVVRHRKLSRLHCRLFLTDNQLCIRDLGSTNGTMVNRVPVSGMQILHMGDLISAGGVVFQVGQIVMPAEPHPGEPPPEASATNRPAATSQSIAASLAPADPSQFEAATDAFVPVPTDLDMETIDWRPEPAAPAPEHADNNSAIHLEGIPHVQPVSAVQIESSFVDKAAEVDPEALPQLSDSPADLDPEEVDLSAFGEQRKGASFTALGNFFDRKDSGKKA